MMRIEDLRNEFKTISEFESIICKKNIKKRKNFQRLEFLGDKVLGLILTTIIFDQYKSFSEGELSKIVSNLCSGKVLFDVAMNIRLDSYLNSNKTRFSKKGLTDTLEAIIGAYFIKCGYSKTVNLINLIWKNKIRKIDKIKVDNKTFLQEWSQARQLGLPKYIVISKSGPDHGPLFTIKVKIKNCKEEIGKGKNLQDAEQDAAKNFLKNLSF